MAASISRATRNLHDFLKSCGTVARVSTNQRYLLTPKIHFISRLRCLSVQPVETAKPDNTTKKAKPLWYYDNKGIRKRKIDQLVRKSLEIKNLEDETTVIPNDVMHMRNLLYVFKSCSFSEDEVRTLIFNKPKIFGLTKRNIYSRMMDLQDYGYPKDTVKKMIMKSPGLLLIDEKEISIQKRITMLQELDFTPKLSHERCIYLVQKCPELLSISEKSVFQSKVKNLQQLGFNAQLIYQLVMKHPYILTCSEKSVKEKVNYITDEIGGRATLFVKFPRAFSASLQRIKERHLYLVKEGFFTGKTIITENKLRAIVLTTDKDFVYRVTNTKMKDFRQFQEQHRMEEADKEIGAVVDKDNEVLNKFHDEPEYESESGGENEIRNDIPDDSKKTYMDAFKRNQKVTSDDDFYSTPFPEINRDISHEGKKTRTRGYRPMKRRESKFV